MEKSPRYLCWERQEEQEREQEHQEHEQLLAQVFNLTIFARQIKTAYLEDGRLEEHRCQLLPTKIKRK